MQWESSEQLFPFLYPEKEVASDMVDVILAVVRFVCYGIDHFWGVIFRLRLFFSTSIPVACLMYLGLISKWARSNALFSVSIYSSPR